MGGGGGGGGQMKFGGFWGREKGGGTWDRSSCGPDPPPFGENLQPFSNCCVDAHLCCFELFIRTF